MTGYFNVFGGDPVQSTNVSFNTIDFTVVNTVLQLSWPPNLNTADVIANIIDVNPQPGITGCEILMPDATETSKGSFAIFFNIGSQSFSVSDFDGNNTIISPLATGTAWLIYLRDNSTQAGEWGLIAYGAGSSTATAAALVGQGITTLPLLNSGLNAQLSVNTLSNLIASYSVVATDRATLVKWTAGAGDVTLPLISAASIGNGFIVAIKNASEAGGQINIYTTGANTLDDVFTNAVPLVMNPNDSAYFTASTNGVGKWSSLGLGQTFVDPVTILNLSVITSIVLTTLQASNQIHLFTAPNVGTFVVSYPQLAAIYYVSNDAASLGTIQVKCSGTGSITWTIFPGDRFIFYCNGTDLYQVPITTFPDGTLALPGIAFDSNKTAGFYYVPSSGGNTPYIGVGINTVNLARFTVTTPGFLVNTKYSFITDETTYMALNAGALDIFASNVNIAKLTSTQLQVKISTLPTTPSYTFLTDTNTGMYNPSADVIALSCGGVETIYISNGLIAFEATDTSNSFQFRQWSGGTFDPLTTVEIQSSRGTPTVQTPIQNNDTVGSLQFSGRGASITVVTSYIQCQATQNYSNTVAGSRLNFRTTPNNTNVPAEALHLDQDQTATFANSITLTAGIIKVPNGLNTAPTHTFTNDITTGLFWTNTPATGFTKGLSFTANQILWGSIAHNTANSVVQMLGINGTVVNPTYSFINGSGYGMYYSASALNFTAGNAATPVLSLATTGITVTGTITLTGALSLYPGSAAATSLNFGTAGTGLYGDATNVNIAISGVPLTNFTTNKVNFYAATSVGDGTSASTTLNVSRLSASSAGTIILTCFSNAASTPNPTFDIYGSRGTGVAPGCQILSGDIIGIWRCRGYDDTAVIGSRNQISVVATENFVNATTSYGAKTLFYVTANASNSASLVLTLDQDQTATFAKGVTLTTGVLLLANGTAAAPAYSFSSATSGDTGMYKISSTSLGLSTAGVLQLSLSTTLATFTNPVVLPAGAVGAPSLTFTGASNSGFYRSGTNVYCAANGIFAFGSSSTQFIIQDATLGTISAPDIRFNTDNNTGLYHPASNQIGIVCNGLSTALFTTTAITLQGQLANPGLIYIQSRGTNGNPNAGISIQGQRGTAAVPQPLLSGDVFGQLQCNGTGNDGSGGTVVVGTARIEFKTIEIWTNSTAGSQINFYTTATGSTSSTLAFTLNTDQTATFAKGVTLTTGVLLLANGTAAAPAYSFSSATSGDTGMYKISSTSLGLSTAGVLQLSLSTTLATFTNPVVLPAGAVGAPALYMSADTTTGLYRPGASQVAVSISGAQVVNITATAVVTAQIISAPVGAVGGPSYAFTGDLTTGIYHPAASQVGVAIAGVLVLTVAAATVTSLQPYVAPLGSLTNVSYEFASDPNTGMYSAGADQLSLVTGGTARITASTTVITHSILMRTVNGSVAAPSYSFTGQTGTGMSYDGVSSLILSSAGANILSMTSTNALFGQAVTLADGAAATPSLNFTTAALTGLYKAAADTVGIACNTVNVASFSGTLFTSAQPITITTGNLTLTNGAVKITTSAVGTPGLYFSTETTTGLYRIGANQLGVAVSGTKTVQIDATNAITVFDTTGNMVINPTNIIWSQASGGASTPLPQISTQASRGTTSSYTPIQNGDYLFIVNAGGNVATSATPSYGVAGSLRFAASQSWTSVPVTGCELQIWTTPNGGIAFAKIATFTNNAALCIGLAATTAAGVQLELSGDAARKLTTTLWTISSDSRIKRNIIDTEEALPIINALRPIKYQYTNQHIDYLTGLSNTKKPPCNVDDVHYGFLADEVEKVLPTCIVSKTGKTAGFNDIREFNPHNIYVLMVKAVQELSAENTDLKNRLEILEKKMTGL